MRGPTLILITTFAAAAAAAPLPQSADSPIEPTDLLLARSVHGIASTPVLNFAKRMLLERLEPLKVKRGVCADESPEELEKRQPVKAGVTSAQQKRSPVKAGVTSAQQKRDVEAEELQGDSEGGVEKREPVKAGVTSAQQKRDLGLEEVTGESEGETEGGIEKREPVKAGVTSAQQKREASLEQMMKKRGLVKPGAE